MIYFCCSDIHGYYNIFKKALSDAGFNSSDPEHKLIICGDILDRGNEAKKIINYLTRLYNQSKLIFVRGNHEDLLEDCLWQLEQRVSISSHHWSNRTLHTVAQLTGIDEYSLVCGCYNYDKDIKPRIKKCMSLIHKSVNYFEVGNYIFVHGWVPYVLKDSHCIDQKEGEFSCTAVPETVLDADDFMWEHARWENGMQAWHMGIKIPGKIIVCGHWHTSFGNYNYHHIGSGEYTEDADFNPFIDNGIIALDSCVALTNKINVFKIKV